MTKSGTWNVMIDGLRRAGLVVNHARHEFFEATDAGKAWLQRYGGGGSTVPTRYRRVPATRRASERAAALVAQIGDDEDWAAVRAAGLYANGENVRIGFDEEGRVVVVRVDGTIERRPSFVGG